MTKTSSSLPLDKRLCFGTYRLNRAFTRFYQRAFAQTDLTYPKFVILLALEERGPLSVSALSCQAGVEPNSLSPLLKKMANFGVISRDRAPEDERRVVIALTDKGRGMLEKAKSVVDQGFVELGLSPQAVAQLLERFDDLQERLESADPPKLSFE